MDEPTEHVVTFYREACRSLRRSPAHRYAEVKAAMRPLLVVVAEVLPGHRFEVAPSTRARSRHSTRAVGRDLSASAFALGARTRALMTSAPSHLDTSSELAVNFVPRSRVRNLT